jgi:hypothetical protein
MGEEEKTPPRETSPRGDNDQPDMEQVQVGKPVLELIVEPL